MIEPIRFFAQGVPKGQPRPKAFARGGIASVYDPGTAEGWKAQVALAAREFLPTRPLDASLSVRMEFYFPRPKAHFGTGRRSREIKPDAPGYHTKKPDVDNAAKAVLDALTVIGMWTDDALVSDLRVRKLYPNLDGSSGCLIEIRDAIYPLTF